MHIFQIIKIRAQHTEGVFILCGIAVPNLVPFSWTTTPEYQIGIVMFLNLGDLKGIRVREVALA